MESITHFHNQRFNKIKKQLEDQKILFVDSLFPATSDALGSVVESFTESEAVEWKRPRDLYDNPRLVCDGRSTLKISGGKLGSSSFLQALQVLAGIKELLFKVIVECNEQDLTPEKYTGLFRFRFWRFSHWVEVVVDDYLPCSEGQLLFTQFSESGQFWPCLLEKAYAKLLGSYAALEEAYISDVLVDFTGGVSETLDLRAGDLSMSEDTRAHLFHTLTADMSDHSIICASIPTEKQEDIGQKTREGLAKGRLYHVTALKKMHITDVKLRNLFKGREKVAVIRVRDTQGIQESSAVSSPTRSTDSSPEVDSRELTASQLTKMLSRKAAWARLKDEDHGRFGLTTESEGEMWMPFEDFSRYFRELIIVRLYNQNIFTLGRKWRDHALHSSWTPVNRSGGGDAKSGSLFENPQFLMDIKSEEEGFSLQLLQEDGSEPSSASSGPPLKKSLAVGLSVFQVECNRKYRLHRQWGFTPLVVSVDHQRRRELAYRGTLRRGRYLLLPTLSKPGSQGRFMLRVISQRSVDLRAVNQDIPSEPCGLSCIASPALWVTVISVKSAVGLPIGKNIFCFVKCEKQSARTELSREANDGVMWDEAFIFYRRKPERAIKVEVYIHNALSRNQFLGMVELQARVNHAPTNLEVNLSDKEGALIADRQLSIDILTEDDLMSV